MNAGTPGDRHSDLRALRVAMFGSLLFVGTATVLNQRLHGPLALSNGLAIAVFVPLLVATYVRARRAQWSTQRGNIVFWALAMSLLFAGWMAALAFAPEPVTTPVAIAALLALVLYLLRRRA